MAEKLPVPNITIDENSTDYAVKMQQIADGQKTSVEAFNAQIDAGNIAENALTKIAKDKADATAEIDTAVAVAKTEISATQTIIKQMQNNVVAVTTGGTATLEAEAGKIPLADATGKIDSKWLPATTLMMSEANFEANRQINREKYDYKSGFVEMGKTTPESDGWLAINEGLSTDPNLVNGLRLGRRGTGVGKSNTDFPLVNIAGVDFSLELNQITNIDFSEVRFPEAPNGTVTRDSADGSIVDFTTDIDPKYGDVASSLNEAVARAFEGDVKNGDFRNGTADWTLSANASMSTDGATIIGDGTSASSAAAQAGLVLLAGVTYVAEFYITDYTGDDACALTVSGATPANSGPIASNGLHKFEFTVANDTTTAVLSFTRWSGGLVKVITATMNSVSIRPVTNEVVTERVDMAGIEFYPEQITPANPEVYPKGMIQSAATTMNGIATKSSTTRPDSYYAVFEGDTASSHQNIDWFAATSEERAKLGADPSNLIVVMANGDAVQWRGRQRTIAGAGNGDWFNISSESDGALACTQQSSFGTVRTQGTSEDSTALTVLGTYAENYWNPEHTFAGKYTVPDTGIFVTRDHVSNRDKSYNDTGVYFLVLGTLPRFNQGVHHPKNELGTRKFRRGVGTNPTMSSSKEWHEAKGLAPDIVSLAELFNLQPTGTPSNVVAASQTTGYIGATAGSGRPDDRFYDAIYASGQGGFIDKRLSISNNLDRAISQRKSDDRSGVSRGGEQLVRTKILNNQYENSGLYYRGIQNSANGSISASVGTDTNRIRIGDDFVVGTPVMIVNPTSGLVLYGSTSTTNGYFRVTASKSNLGMVGHNTTDFTALGSDPVYVFLQSKTNLTVSGEFNVMEVIGDPANILLANDLKDGWIGYWNPNIPDGLMDNPQLVRKYTDSANISNTISDDNGTTWTHQNTVVDAVTNSLLWNNIPSGNVHVLNYTTNAYITKESVNSVVYRGKDGLGDVFIDGANSVNRGCLLAESLSGLIVTNSTVSGTRYANVALLSASLLETDKLSTNNSYESVHSPIALKAPTNDSHAVKALWGTTEINGQLFPVYWWTELKYSTGSWNDDSLIHANDNTTTMTDLDGNTVLVGCAIGIEPICWADKL